MYVRAAAHGEHHPIEHVAELSDEQLDIAPAAGDMRFADGQRTLEQTVASLLKHQRHQVDALSAAVA